MSVCNTYAIIFLSSNKQQQQQRQRQEMQQPPPSNGSELDKIWNGNENNKLERARSLKLMIVEKARERVELSSLLTLD